MGIQIKRCVIFTGGELNARALDKSVFDNAYIIAADSGLKYVRELGLVPDLAIGDFDSLGYKPTNLPNVKTFPPEKDDSDLMLAIKEALRLGFEDIAVAGALGGRFDHTLANVQALAYIADNGAHGSIIGENEEILMLVPDEYIFKSDSRFSLSLFAYSDTVDGLSIDGVKYPLKGGLLTNKFPLGLSNVITADTAHVSFESGLLLAVRSRL